VRIGAQLLRAFPDAALPLTVLPDISPRKQGERKLAATLALFSATVAIGESGDDSIPRPVYGERMPAGR